jgi:hypothetical protein
MNVDGMKRRRGREKREIKEENRLKWRISYLQTMSKNEKERE